MGRSVYIVGNWKMYKTAHEATSYIEALLPKIEHCKENIYLAVPFTSIAPCAAFCKDSNLVIGAQNMSDAREGAFTGEIAGLMLKEAGAFFVILGHSERRHLFHETDAMIARKVVRALQDDIQPILCVGETLEERKQNRTEEVLRAQIEAVFSHVPKEDASRIVLAYEPVWAIGTGQQADEKTAAQAHAFCRSVLADLFGGKIASAISILYGGSVRPETAQFLLQEEEIDGVLVGGASLDPDSFARIIEVSQKN